MLAHAPENAYVNYYLEDRADPQAGILVMEVSREGELFRPGHEPLYFPLTDTPELRHAAGLLASATLANHKGPISLVLNTQVITLSETLWQGLDIVLSEFFIGLDLGIPLGGEARVMH